MAHVAALICDNERIGVIQIDNARDLLYALRKIGRRDLVAAKNRIALGIESLKVITKEAVGHPDVALFVHPERTGMDALGVGRELLSPGSRHPH